VKRRSVTFSPAARDDVFAIYDYIATLAGSEVAYHYIQRIETFCLKLDLASQRGNKHDDVRKGLRTVGFERRLTIAFSVDEEQVTILRIHQKGRNWTEDR